MHDREERIANAYKNTFQWIWEDSISSEKRWSSFIEWAESDSQLYWITGKAGSGKSTLMKFICQDDDFGTLQQPSDAMAVLQTGERSANDSRESRCKMHLRKWAEDSTLITAAFFFWNSGVHVQMTQKGLLFSLLFQILRQAPELIPSVSPTRWEALCLFNEDPREWTEQEMHQTLRLTIEKLSCYSKICLFVDGLDEFDGNHDNLILLFKDLIGNRNVKICVSSRPWLVFEDAFEHRPSLRLEDLSYHDIKHYVVTHFNESSGFAQLCRREPEFADQLVDNIVNKASGVFLWVHLVVASLIAGMGFADRVSDLRRRLESLPPDLELLYENILLSLDPFYLEHAAQLFKLVQESPDPPSILLLSFADEEDPQFALKFPIQSLSQSELTLRVDTMRRRLNSRCKGFLEVGTTRNDLQNQGHYTVQYLHRTVKDYIEKEEAQRRLQCAIKMPFDPHFQLSMGNLAHLKVINRTTDFLDDGTFWSRVERCMCSASRIRPSHRGGIIPLLDELDRTGAFLVKQIANFEDTLSFYRLNLSEPLSSSLKAGKWVASHPALTELSFVDGLDPKFGGNFLSLTVRYGIVEFVEAKSNQGCLVRDTQNGLWPLLVDAISVSHQRRSEYHDTVPHLDMVICLLKKGADPNFLIPANSARTAISVWVHTLDSMLEDYDGICLKSPWLAIVHAMIEHKAEVSKDMMSRLKIDNWEWDGRRLSGKKLKLYQELLAIQRASSKTWSLSRLWKLR